MKNTLSCLLTAFTLATLPACTKEEASQPAEEFFMKAQKNGQAWQRPASGTLVRSKGEFYLFGQDRAASGTQDYLRLSFRLDKGQPVAAAQVLPAEWGELVGGDVIVDSYTTGSTQPLPTLEITRLDTVQKIVEGRFGATLRREARWSSQGEVMRFENGSFRVRYQVFP